MTPSPDAYERFVRSADYRRERAEKAAVILRLCGDRLAAAERIADLGAGTGLIKKRLEAKLDKLVYGFDIDASFMRWRRGMTVADALRLPVPDGAFDFLLLNHLYEHVRDQAALFREAYRALRPGGWAYVAAGNVLWVVEPHYRLPFLSWLPRPAADAYLRLTGRGRAYEGIRFRTHGRLVSLMEDAGFRVRDLTEEALGRLLGPGAGARGGPSDAPPSAGPESGTEPEEPDAPGSRGWGAAWRLLRALPASPRGALLRTLSPQWFFLLEKPGAAHDGRGFG